MFCFRNNWLLKVTEERIPATTYDINISGPPYSSPRNILHYLVNALINKILVYTMLENLVKKRLLHRRCKDALSMTGNYIAFIDFWTYQCKKWNPLQSAICAFERLRRRSRTYIHSNGEPPITTISICNNLSLSIMYVDEPTLFYNVFITDDQPEQLEGVESIK